MTTRWGDRIPDDYDARREGRRSRSYDRNPYDDLGVSRREEEAHDAWERGHREAEDERRREREEEERAEQHRIEQRRQERMREEAWAEEAREREERYLAEQSQEPLQEPMPEEPV